MAYTWGSTALNIQSFGNDAAQLNLAELPLIPDPAADHDASPSSVLMGAGRLRRRVTLDGFASVSDYAAMKSDAHDMTSRTLELDSGDSLTAMIQSLTGVRDVARGAAVWYTATFVEV